MMGENGCERYLDVNKAFCPRMRHGGGPACGRKQLKIDLGCFLLWLADDRVVGKYRMTKAVYVVDSSLVVALHAC